MLHKLTLPVSLCFDDNGFSWFLNHDFQVALSEDYVVESLPTKDQTLDVMSITWVLSQLGTNSLGDFEEQYAYDPTSLLALDRYAGNTITPNTFADWKFSLAAGLQAG